MQIRPKTYLHFISLHFVSLWRLLRDAIPPRQAGVPAEASPLLIYTAIVLAWLLAILEVDAHRGELESLGLLSSDYLVPAAFLSP